jgi:hypothetical protein
MGHDRSAIPLLGILHGTILGPQEDGRVALH